MNSGKLKLIDMSKLEALHQDLITVRGAFEKIGHGFDEWEAFETSLLFTTEEHAEAQQHYDFMYEDLRVLKDILYKDNIERLKHGNKTDKFVDMELTVEIMYQKNVKAYLKKIETKLRAWTRFGDFLKSKSFRDFHQEARTV